ncbi:uncharacterized protein LOC135464839 [Liolophura sinensis]|uniref:uncharacterized protein LOC135464839 n=1 Tax=Liolophura sinensis TaxID=3198878 RepID=UPI003158A032
MTASSSASADSSAPEPCSPDADVCTEESVDPVDVPVPPLTITRATQYSRKHCQRNKGSQTELKKINKATQTTAADIVQQVSATATIPMPMCSTPRKRTASPNLHATPVKLARLSSPEETPIKNVSDPEYIPSDLSFEEQEFEKELESESEVTPNKIRRRNLLCSSSS